MMCVANRFDPSRLMSRMRKLASGMLSGSLIAAMMLMSSSLHALNANDYYYNDDGTYDIVTKLGVLIAASVPCPPTKPPVGAT